MSFGGIPAAQRVQDYYLWEVVLNEHPELRGIVELGTWEGGFSCYLAAQAGLRGLAFRTYDVRPPEREIPGFVHLDIFREAEAIGRLLREWEPVILFCDGGNKPREARTFTPYLSEGSLLAVHDWGTETFAHNLPECLEMLYPDEFEALDSMTRFFRVTA